MAEHTPGPWEAMQVVGGPTLYQAHVLIEPGVAAVWCPPGNDQAEANARLIAAAPDLLAACKALPLDCEFEDAADFKDNAKAFLKAMDLARAAIAKAEVTNAPPA